MWTYRVTLGELYDVQGERIAVGYSGAPEAKNDVTKEAIPFVGPIPRGWYRMGTAYESAQCGPVTIPLTPTVSTQTFNRNDFEMHGDAIGAPGTASHGCIILDRPTRERLAASVDRDVHVTD